MDQVNSRRMFLLWSCVKRVCMSVHALTVPACKLSSLFLMFDIVLWLSLSSGTMLLVGLDTAPVCLSTTQSSLLAFPGGKAHLWHLETQVDLAGGYLPFAAVLSVDSHFFVKIVCRNAAAVWSVSDTPDISHEVLINTYLGA